MGSGQTIIDGNDHPTDTELMLMPLVTITLYIGMNRFDVMDTLNEITSAISVDYIHL